MKVHGLQALKAMQDELARRRQEARRAAAHAQRLEQQLLQAQHDDGLFARSVGPVTPLRARARADVRTPRPAPVPRQRLLDEREVLRESLAEVDTESLMETDDRLSYRRSWVGADVLRKLRRGAWVVQAHVDLHGLRRDEAHDALAIFLAEAARRGWRCVRIVRGKGHGSPGGRPVLKDKVRHWLAQRRGVLAFTQARGPDGGAGALIVLLDAPAARRPPAA